MDDSDTSIDEATLAAYLEIIRCRDADLVASAQKAFADVVDAFHDLLILYLEKGLGLSFDEALDVSQTILFDLWRKPLTFDPRRARPGELTKAFWGWLKSVARNFRNTHLRSKVRRERREQDPSASDKAAPERPDEHFARQEEIVSAAELVAAFRLALTDEREQITLGLMLSEGPDFDLTLLMERCGCSRPTAFRLRRRVLSRLETYAAARAKFGRGEGP